MQHIILDGNKIKNRFDFELEIKRVFTRDVDWINYDEPSSFNLDAINDFLWGGFGVFENDDTVRLLWLNSAKNKENLGKDETIEYLNYQLTRCHETAIDDIRKRLVALTENS